MNIENKNNLRIALTKGRIEKQAVEMFEKNGVDCSALRDKGRKLIFPIPIGNDGLDSVDVLLVKPTDVITYVELGICDIGIVGKDTIMENGTSFYEIADLGFGKCKMALASKAKYAKNPEQFYHGYGKKVIATKFEKIAREFFSENKNLDIDIIKIEGSVEIAPVLGFADAIVDIVETGTTLRENGLEVIEEIFDISARLIVNVASMKMKKNAVDIFSKKLGVWEEI